jgi:hypothetical protein
MRLPRPIRRPLWPGTALPRVQESGVVGVIIPATPPTAADAMEASTASAAISEFWSTAISAPMQVTDNPPMVPGTYKATRIVSSGNLPPGAEALGRACRGLSRRGLV